MVSKALWIIMVSIMLLIIGCHSVVSSNIPYLQNTIYISKVEVSVTVDPELNISYVEETVYLSSYVSELTTLYIDLISDDISNVRFVRAYGEGDVEFPARYIVNNRTIEVVVSNTSFIKIEYIPIGLVIPIGLGYYELSIDLSYENIEQVSGEVIVPKNFDILVIGTGDYSVERNDFITILLHDPEEYTIVLMKNFTTTIPTSPTTSPPATSPSTGTSPTTSPATSAPTETTSPSTEFPTTYTSPSPPVTDTGKWLPLLLVAALALVGIGIAWFFMRRRREEIVIETISPTDILSDDIIRDILLVVGDSGEKGIAQNRLVRIIGKPKSTISRKIRRLSEAGYIDVERAGRSNIVRLTGKGWDIYRKLKSGEFG